MQLMNKSIKGIVEGTNIADKNPNKLVEWHIRDDKTKAMIGLALSNWKLHHVYLDKYLKDISNNLNRLFGAQAANAKFS